MRAQHAVGVAAVSLEEEHGVDQVLEHPRAGDGAFLGDVADDDDRRAGVLGEGGQPVPHLAHLRHRAGRALYSAQRERLDGIHREDAGPQLARMLERDLRVRLRREVQRGRERAQPLAAQPDLLQRLLPAHVEDRKRRPRELVQRREEQRALADARISREQHHRAGDESASESAVQLADARPVPPSRRERHLIDGQHRGKGAPAGRGLLFHRAEGAAPAALAEPLGRPVAALLADVLYGRFSHARILAAGSDMHAAC